MVSRREALRTLGAVAVTGGIAGCLSSPISNQVDSNQPDLSFTAEVLRSFTTEHPGGIRLQFKNTTDDTLLFLTQESPGQRGMFIPVKGSHQSSSAELLLLQPDSINCRTERGTPSAIPDTPTDQSDGDGCWRPPCEDLILYQIMPTWQELEPDSPKRAEYVLLNGFNDTCLPAGQYNFLASGRIAKGHLTEDGEIQFDSEKFRIERKLTITISDNLEVSASAEATVSALESSG